MFCKDDKVALLYGFMYNLKIWSQIVVSEKFYKVLNVVLQFKLFKSHLIINIIIFEIY